MDDNTEEDGYKQNPFFKDPSTESAKFLKGTHDGRLGSRERNTTNPGMSESEMRKEEAKIYGIPAVIYGKPLGCGCYEAVLSGSSEIVNGTLEANYKCASAWDNYVTFQVRQYAGDSKTSLKINKFGELEESTGFEAGELGEM